MKHKNSDEKQNHICKHVGNDARANSRLEIPYCPHKPSYHFRIFIRPHNRKVLVYSNRLVQFDRFWGGKFRQAYFLNSNPVPSSATPTDTPPSSHSGPTTRVPENYAAGFNQGVSVGILITVAIASTGIFLALYFARRSEVQKKRAQLLQHEATSYSP